MDENQIVERIKKENFDGDEQKIKSDLFEFAEEIAKDFSTLNGKTLVKIFIVEYQNNKKFLLIVISHLVKKK